MNLITNISAIMTTAGTWAVCRGIFGFDYDAGSGCVMLSEKEG